MVQIKIPNKLYVRLFAGMGDFYKRYFCHLSWQCLEDLKLKHPNVDIHALVVSQTISALDLVDYHPCISKVIKPKIHLREFKNEDVKKYMGDYVFLTPNIAKTFNRKVPPIYLSDKDKIFIDKITNEHKKYICLHPFAGDKYGLDTRTPLKIEEYIPTIKAIINKGHEVFLLGKTWDRIIKGTNKTKKIEEKFDYRMKGLVNLIDKTNVRTAAELIRRSNGFVGTASSFMCAAWSMNNIKTVIITSKRWEKPLNEMIWAKERIKNKKHKVIYLDRERSPNILENIGDVTAKWF